MQGSWTVVGPGKRLPARLMGDVRVAARCRGRLDGVRRLDLPVVDVVATAHENELVGHLGPDPLREDWDPAEAVAAWPRDPAAPLAAALLDQRNLAGLGNLWVNELCFLRGLSPWTPVGDVDVPALVRLAAPRAAQLGAVPAAYQVTTGNTRRGEQHWVAGRAGRPCLRCGTPVLVVEEVPDDPEQRRTWWCPVCQPGPSPQPRVSRPAPR